MKYVAAVYSALIWGSGQFINKQKLKGLIFFLLQVAFISIELITSGIWKIAAMLTIESGSFNLGVFFQNLLAQLGDIHNYGFFIKGVWGLITLGTRPRVQAAEVYDHSIMLMLGGIIAVITLLIFAAIWIFNIRDAYKTRKLIDSGKEVSSVQYFKDLWKNSFEYIMISPGLILVLFISLVPIIFAILVAFTNYNANFIPPRRLVEWRGFETF